MKNHLNLSTGIQDNTSPKFPTHTWGNPVLLLICKEKRKFVSYFNFGLSIDRYPQPIPVNHIEADITVENIKRGIMPLPV